MMTAGATWATAWLTALKQAGRPYTSPVCGLSRDPPLSQMPVISCNYGVSMARIWVAALPVSSGEQEREQRVAPASAHGIVTPSR